MITDTFTLSSTREVTPEGFLKADAAVTCVGVQTYLGSELDPSLEPMKQYNVFRSADVVFSDGTKKSLAMKPVVMGHPRGGQFVTADNALTMPIVGTVGERVFDLGDGRLGASVVITDADAIRTIEDSNSEVSLGYTCETVLEKGEFEGVPYDFKFVGDMEINHLALAGNSEGRCGREVKVLDTVKKNEDEKLTAKKDAPKKAINDALDMTALTQKLTEKLMPEMKNILASDEFMSSLTDRLTQSILASMGGDDDAAEVVQDEDMTEADADVAEPDDMLDATEPRQYTDPGEHAEKKDLKMDTLKKTFEKKIEKKVELLEKAKLFDTSVTASMSDRLILLKALKNVCDVDTLKKKSVAYLQGQLDVFASERKSKRENASRTLSTAFIDSVSDNVVMPSIHEMKTRKRSV